VTPDQLAFAEFYAAAKDDCLRTVLAITGDRPSAEDAVSEAFGRAWASWRKVSRHPAPRAWVIRTALNVRVSWWRRQRHEVPLDAAGSLADSPALAHDHDHDHGELFAVVLRLPLRQRQVVALRVFLGLDTAQTARALGIAPGTVTAHMTRALAALRADYTPELRGEKS
jgi:RNA polymerase sigma factor (sigma-70 family)